jgi:hypothetical protein
VKKKKNWAGPRRRKRKEKMGQKKKLKRNWVWAQLIWTPKAQ